MCHIWHHGEIVAGISSFDNKNIRGNSCNFTKLAFYKCLYTLHINYFSLQNRNYIWCSLEHSSALLVGEWDLLLWTMVFPEVHSSRIIYFLVNLMPNFCAMFINTFLDMHFRLCLLDTYSIAIPVTFMIECLLLVTWSKLSSLSNPGNAHLSQWKRPWIWSWHLAKTFSRHTLEVVCSWLYFWKH